MARKKHPIQLTIVILLLLVLPPFFSACSKEDWGSSIAAQSVGINSTGAAPLSSAMLDVNASNKGLLIPRVSLTSSTDITTITSPATSLLIYNTASAGTTPNNVIPGFYFWDGSRWVPLLAQSVFAQSVFAEFYALMPPNNPATIPPGAPVEFPNFGPANGNGIFGVSNNTYQLNSIGTYRVSWVVSVAEPGQLGLQLNGVLIGSTISGRSSGSTQIVGDQLIVTTSSFSTLRLINPPGSPSSLTISPYAGGNQPVSATLVITRIF